MTSPKLLAVGGAHVDRRGQVSGIFVPGASNPGSMAEEVGGGVFNALRNAVNRGIAASLLSVRGGDGAGDMVARAIAASGITDLSAVFLDRATPSYTALLDRDGEVIAGLADMGLYESAFARQLSRSKAREAVAAADAVLTDANVPAQAIARLVATARGKPVFAIAISPAKVGRLAESLAGVSCLFMNRAEASSLSGLPRDASAIALAEKLTALGLRSGVVTAGAQPVVGFDAGGVFSVVPPVPATVADVTGAGDALAGVTIAAIMRGRDLRAALREGIAAAILNVQSPAAVAAFSARSFAAALALVPEAQAVA